MLTNSMSVHRNNLPSQVHSDLKDFTGLLKPVLRVWMLTVASEIATKIIAGITNVIQPTSVWNAKLLSQFFAARHTSGNAITLAKMIIIIKSVENMYMILGIVAPNTFLIAISLVRWEIMNVDKPNNPKDATALATVMKINGHG